MNRAHFTSTISILLATLVVLSSLHMVQVLGASAMPGLDGKKISHDDTSVTKIVSELHHHSDKSGTDLIKNPGDHQMYIDARSLRLVHKKDSIRTRLAARWLRTLQEMHLLHLG